MQPSDFEPRRDSPTNVRIGSKAGNWLSRCETGEPSSRTRKPFSGWRRPRPLYSSPFFLRHSLAHLRAYKELQRLWEDARHYESGRTVDVESLLAAARPESNVISIVDPRGSVLGCAGIAGKDRVPASYGRFKWAAAAAGLAVVIIAGLLGASLYLPLSQPQEYATRIGEQRTVRFPDGSTAKLDGASRIRVRFRAQERRVDLLQGQALFTVAKNAQRPFVVVSGGTRVRDTGTQFDVNQMPSSAIVTVVEGRVEVTNPCSHPIELGAAQQVVMTCSTIPRRQPANLETTTAWTRHELIFDSTPLMQVAVEFNRSNIRQLEIEGTRLQNLQLGGVFKVLDPTSLPHLVQLLRSQPGVQVIEAGDRITVSEK